MRAFLSPVCAELLTPLLNYEQPTHRERNTLKRIEAVEASSTTRLEMSARDAKLRPAQGQNRNGKKQEPLRLENPTCGGSLSERSCATDSGGGATHAWMQTYLPGAGWVHFDPTNSIIGNRKLIRVAVAWSPVRGLPLWGTFEGSANAFLGMDVSVSVREESPERDDRWQ